jgi:hypothetical protein
LIRLRPPGEISRGATITVVVPHTIPEELGEQSIHVTFKGANGKQRIARQVLSASGKGSLRVTFEVPGDLPEGSVSFAAFIGEDYESCLQHLSSKPVAVK